MSVFGESRGKTLQGRENTGRTVTMAMETHYVCAL